MNIDRAWNFSNAWEKTWLLMSILVQANRYQPKSLPYKFSYLDIDWQEVKVNNIYPNLEETREILFFLQEIDALEIEKEIEVQFVRRFHPAIWKLKLNRSLFKNAYVQVSKLAGIIMFETRKKELSDNNKKSDDDVRPRTISIKGLGYLKFGKHGSKKKIGISTGRPFKFLETVLTPINTYKSVEAVFSSMWNEKDKNNSTLSIITRADKVKIIKNSAIKELQKEHKLHGSTRTIKFEFNGDNTQVKATLIE